MTPNVGTRARARVLLVEDCVEQAALIERWLVSTMNAEVLAFDRAESALDQFRAGNYDLAIVDIQLPGMSGNEFIFRARRIDSGLVCLVTSASEDVDAEQVVLQPGVAAFLRKPLDRGRLLTSAERLLDGRIRPSPSDRPSRVLVVAADRGDAEIGCGGAILNHAARRDEVIVFETTEADATCDLALRRSGVRRIHEPFESFDDQDLARLIARTCRLVRDLKPDVVYMPAGGDARARVRHLNRAMQLATRGVGRVLCYQTPTAKADFEPQTFVEIPDGMAAKLDMVWSRLGHADMPLGSRLRATARRWGERGHHPFSEGFEILRGSEALSPKSTAASIS